MEFISKKQEAAQISADRDISVEPVFSRREKRQIKKTRSRINGLREGWRSSKGEFEVTDLAGVMKIDIWREYPQPGGTVVTRKILHVTHDEQGELVKANQVVSSHDCNGFPFADQTSDFVLNRSSEDNTLELEEIVASIKYVDDVMAGDKYLTTLGIK